ncbi:MAG: phosphatase PAP2 family protein [Lysinibacillus sp.]
MTWKTVGVFGLLLFVVIAFSYKSAFWQTIDNGTAQMLEGKTWLIAFHVIGNKEVIFGLTFICSVYIVLRKKVLLPALFCVFVVTFGYNLNQFLKSIFLRPRPDVVGQLTSYSFPSGHAMVTTVCLLTLIFVVQQQFFKLKQMNIEYTVVFTIVMLVALSRVAEARHYFSDVLAGVGLGVAYVAVAVYIYKKIIR